MGESAGRWRYSLAAIGLAGVGAFAVLATTTSIHVEDVLVSAGLPLAIYSLVAAYGLRLADRQTPTHVVRVATIAVGTTLGYLVLTTAFLALVGYDHGFLDAAHALSLGYGTASAGLAFGAVGGHHYVRQREQARELERANAELREQNERLDEFASILGHDLRNPLAVASGYVDLATETGNIEHLEDVRACHDRIDALVEQVLALARLERDPDAVTAVDVAGVATDALETVDIGDGELLVDVDATVCVERSDLRQVFENCYRNAAEHAGPDPTVRVTAVDDGAGFAIEDDGPGIPERERDTVFDRGYSNGDGTGLGLAIVGEIAATYEWTVDVDESAAGGARLEFRTSPRDADHPGPEEPSVADDDVDRGHRASVAPGT
ncbi:HAMP domain-containing histidine kinase [Halorubellus sp. JP-L1]|uniref:sensor histidine kinase n=1 Tax=Halorubellus sp. JP-L1 TaxID=2715753 RepID=UPI001408C9D1|nr:HAMP domain-containing sensor histidine kinase [Halorubellus sp. JP-L1]NHN41317.1 HAMP domain-containing histidine kinase [Halorubellus sp. JP-L1]